MHMFTIAHACDIYYAHLHSLCRTLDKHLSMVSLSSRSDSTVAAVELSNLLTIVVYISPTSMVPFTAWNSLL